MTGKTKTMIFIVASVFLWVVYDAYIIIDAGKDASISQVIIDYFYAYPIGAVAFGIVIGHLAWRMPDRPCKKCGYNPKKG
ncbi:MAG: hypothetical protein IMF01_09400 [Proteobacteria bacterium]|nr:hypothetical protein [Pseudomonadota bacterium]